MDLAQLISVARDDVTVGELRKLAGLSISNHAESQEKASHVPTNSAQKAPSRKGAAWSPAKSGPRKGRGPSLASGLDIQLLDRVLEHLQGLTSGEGAKSTELQTALGVSRAALARALNCGLETQKLRAEGEKRARTYFRV